MCVAAHYSVIIHSELHVAANMKHAHMLSCIWYIYTAWMFSTCRLSKYEHNFYYYAEPDKVHNKKWGITAQCRSNLIGCLQSTVPLRHMIKDHFFCTGSDIMCKQRVLQWVCMSVCEKRLEAGAFLPCWDLDENFVLIQQKACDSVLNYFWL